MSSCLNEALYRLTNLYDKWRLAQNMHDKSNVESSVIRLINNRRYIPDEIYLEACDNAASGLCQRGFFEEDLQRLISIIRAKLITGC